MGEERQQTNRPDTGHDTRLRLARLQEQRQNPEPEDVPNPNIGIRIPHMEIEVRDARAGGEQRNS